MSWKRGNVQLDVYVPEWSEMGVDQRESRDPVMGLSYG